MGAVERARMTGVPVSDTSPRKRDQGNEDQMAGTPTPLVAGNWKMYGLRRAAGEVEALRRHLSGAHGCAVAICPPATLLAGPADRFRDSGIIWGGQDCAVEAGGAQNSDGSAELLADAGARAVIEERRDK